MNYINKINSYNKILVILTNVFIKHKYILYLNHEKNGGTMDNNIEYLIKTVTLEQAKEQVEKIKFVDKNLKDFNKRKEIIDNVFNLQNEQISREVQNVLLFYIVYKIKGGK